MKKLKIKNKFFPKILLGLKINILLIANSYAGGYSSSLYSTSGLGTAYSGSATGSHDISDSFFNPAVTAGMNKSEVILSGSFLNLSIDPDLMQSNLAPAGTETKNVGTKKLIPAFYVSTPINKNVNLNFAVTTPFGLETRYNRNWVGKYRAVDSSISTINFNPSLAFKINDKLSLGAGLVAQRYEAELTKKAILNANPLVEGYGRLKGSDWGYGFNLGALYKISSNTNVGVGYRSAIKHNLKGNIRVNDNLMVSKFKSNTITPESLTIGASHNLTDDLQILSDITLTRWSRLKSLKVTANNSLLDSTSKYNWNNSVLYSVGSNYKIGDKDIFRFGLAYEKDAVNDRNREPTVPNGDKYWITAGLNHKFENNLEVDFTYAYQKYKANKININEMGNNQGTLVGKYQLRADVISLAIKKQF